MKLPSALADEQAGVGMYTNICVTGFFSLMFHFSFYFDDAFFCCCCDWVCVCMCTSHTNKHTPTSYDIAMCVCSIKNMKQVEYYARIM